MSHHDVSTASQEANNHHFEGWLGKLEANHGSIAKVATVALIVMAVIFLGTVILVDRSFVVTFSAAASGSTLAGLIIFLGGMVYFLSGD